MKQRLDHDPWLRQAPTPVVLPVILAFDAEKPVHERHDGLCFALYQLLRCTGLMLLSEALVSPPVGHPDTAASKAIVRVLGQIRYPFYSDWITLLATLTKHRLALRFTFPQPEQVDLLHRLKDWKVAPAGFESTIGEQPILHAFRLLRNLIAHGGSRSEALCRQDLDTFLPLLRQLAEGPFACLADCEMLALQGRPGDDGNRLWRMNGPAIARQDIDLEDEQHADLAAAFEHTPILFRSRVHGRLLNIYPWFLYREEEHIPNGMLDGFFLRENKRIIFYLDQERGVPFESGLGASPGMYWKEAHARLGELLGQWHISWEFDLKTMAPWKLRNPIEYHTVLLIESHMQGRKYIPSAYCERALVDDALGRFCFGSPQDETHPWRGVLLTGEMGRGKSALLAHLAMERQRWRNPTESDPLLLFARCDGGGMKAEIRGEDDLFFRNVAPCLGLRIGSLESNGYIGFAQFLTHLHKEFQHLEAPSRLVLLIDAVNEAPYPESLLVDIVRFIEHGRNFPWLRVVFSVRTSYLLTLRAKRADHGGHEANPLHDIRDLLLPCPWKDTAVPEWELPALLEEETRTVFTRYRESSGLPHCLDAFDDLKQHWQREDGLLRNPLHLHLWMEAFDGRRSASVAGVEELFEHWLHEKLGRYDALAPHLDAVLAWLFRNGAAGFDEALELAFRQEVEKGLSVDDRRVIFNPLEALLGEGVMIRPVRGERGAQFPFEALAACCFARHFDALSHGGREVGPVLAGLERTGERSLAPLFAAAAVWLERLFRQKSWPAMAALLQSEPVRENAMLPWLLRAMDPREGAEAWGRDFGACMAACGADTRAWIANKIIWQWTKLISERFMATQRQSELTRWAVDWYRERGQDGSPEGLRDLSVSLNNYGDVLKALGGEANLNKALALYEESRQLCEVLKNPAMPESLRDLAVALDRCGDANEALGGVANLHKALEYYKEAQRYYSELKNPAKPLSLRDLSVSLNKYGDALMALGGEANRSEALALYEESRQLCEVLKNPAMPESLRDLAVALDRCGDANKALGGVANLHKALEYHKEAQRYYSELKNPAKPLSLRDLSVSLNKYGDALMALGGEANRSKALALYEESRQLCEVLKNPAMPESLRDLAVALDRCGGANEALGGAANLHKALEYHKEAQRYYCELKNPAIPLSLRDLSVSLNKYGDALMALGGEANRSKALALYEESRQLCEVLKNPAMPESLRDLALALDRCGDANKALGGAANLHKALEYHKEAQRYYSELKNPAKPLSLRDLSVSLNKYGDALMALGGEANRSEALALYEESRQLCEVLKNPAMPESLRDLAVALDRCGDANKALGGVANLHKALEYYKEAQRYYCELKNPAIPLSLRDLSVSLIKYGDALMALGGEANLNKAFQLYQETRQLAKEYRQLCNTAQSWTDCWVSARRVAQFAEDAEARRIFAAILRDMDAYRQTWGPLPPDWVQREQWILRRLGQAPETPENKPPLS